MAEHRPPASRRAYAKRHRVDVAAGRSRALVPAREVRPVVAALAAADVPVTTIAAHAGCSAEVVRGVLARTRKAVTASTAEGLRSVRLDRILATGRPTDMLPATGARRRVQALLALGHSHDTITAAMGYGRSRDLVTTGRVRWVTRALHDAVTRAYDQLSMTPGTSRATRTRALAAGYVPPLAWDDDEIDNPKARPRLASTPRYGDAGIDELAVELALAGVPTDLTHAERLRVVPVLAARGWTSARIAEVCRCTTRTVQRIRETTTDREDQAA